MDFQNINREIAQFLDKNPSYNTLPKIEYQQEQRTDIDILIEQLKNLERLYREIKEKISTDEIPLSVKNSVESNLICDTFIKILKDVSIERNEAIAENRKNKEFIENCKAESEKSQKNFTDLKKIIENKNAKIDEFSRLLADEKNSCLALRNKINAHKKSEADFRIINAELENMNRRNHEKIAILKKEMDCLKEVLSRREEEINEAKRIKKEGEELVEKYSEKIKETDLLVEGYKKKIKEKNNTVELINDEMGKILRESKEREVDYAKMHEKLCAYKARCEELENKNEFFSEALSKNEIAIPENYAGKNIKGNLRNAKKKLKNYKNLLEEKNNFLHNHEEKIKNLQAENEHNKKAAESNKKIINDLMKKMEGLLNKNLEYQQEILTNKTNLKEEEFYDATSKIFLSNENLLDHSFKNYAHDIDNYAMHSIKNYAHKLEDYAPKKSESFKNINYGEIVKNESKKITKKAPPKKRIIKKAKDLSIDSVATTESMKIMRAKTTDLKKKFDELDGRLKAIQDDNTLSNEDKVKMQTDEMAKYYYSDLDAFEESDFL